MFYVSTPTSHLTRSFTDRVTDVRNCADAAKTGWDGTFRVPSPQAPLPQAEIEISGFHGPGTYTPTMLQHDITTAVARRTPARKCSSCPRTGPGSWSTPAPT